MVLDRLRFFFNMKTAFLVTVFVHITLPLLIASGDAQILSNFATRPDFNESLLQSGNNAMFGDNWTDSTSLPFPPPLENAADTRVWPALELNWRVAVGSILLFIGGALGCTGGIGGGGIFVPILVLVIGFDEKSSTALSKCMIMAASAASVVYSFRLESPVLDYDLALVFQPMLMLGISIGVIFNVIFPNWIVTILLLVLFTGTSLKTLVRAISLYKKETMEKYKKQTMEQNKNETMEKLLDKEGKLAQGCLDTDLLYKENLDLLNKNNPDLESFDVKESNSLRMHWKSFVALGYVWISFLILQIVKNYTTTCNSYYWLWTILQVPVAASVFFAKAIQLYVRNRRNNGREVEESLVSEIAPLKWTFPILCLCAFTGLLAGTVGGLLGLGGGFIIGPLFLELGLLPEVASATASFIMLFSSSMSVVEYYLLHRFPVPFALYLAAINIVAAIWAQLVLRKIIDLWGRASIIVFTISFAILLSALCLGGYGIEDTISKLEEGEYMGFLSLC